MLKTILYPREKNKMTFFVVAQLLSKINLFQNSLF